MHGPLSTGNADTDLIIAQGSWTTYFTEARYDFPRQKTTIGENFRYPSPPILFSAVAASFLYGREVLAAHVFKAFRAR